MRKIFIGLIAITILTTGCLSLMVLRSNVRILYERGITVEIFLAIIVALLSAWALVLFLILNQGRTK